MDVGSPEWIENSLARLDELEAKQGRLESELDTIEDPAALAGKSRELAVVEAELKSLYSMLESVADEDDADDAGATEAVPVSTPRATQGDDELSAPHGIAAAAAAAGVASSAPMSAPVAQPSVAAPAAAPPSAAALSPAPLNPEPLSAAPLSPAPPSAAALSPAPLSATPQPAPAPVGDSPFGSPPPTTGGGGFDSPAPMAFDDDDLKPKGGGSKWVFLGLVLAGGLGIGGFFIVQNMQGGKEQPAKAPGEVQVIKAADVPDDTEAPPTAPSGTAVVSPNASGDGGGSGGGNNKKKKKTTDKKKTIKLGGGDAPLGGI